LREHGPGTEDTRIRGRIHDSRHADCVVYQEEDN
jgi:hypothetical protein